jgi:hypothetical protein
LPTHAGLSDLDMDRIVSTLSRVLAQMND